MKKRKIRKPLTYGYLPINMDANKLIHITYQSGLRYRVLIFYKAIFNLYKKQYSTSTPDYTQFVALHSTLVEKILGANKAKEGIELLVSNGLLEMTGYKFDLSDPSNNYPRSFRIPERYLDLQLFGKTRYYRKVPIYDKKAANAEHHYKEERLKFYMGNQQDGVLKRLSITSQDLHLDLSSKEARQIIQDNGFNNRTNNYSYYMFLHQINQREIEWFKKDKYGRLHFAWVSLSKKCHPLLRFRGYETHQCQERDITNSQPYFSSIINAEVVARMMPEASHLVEGIDFDTPTWLNYRYLCLTGTFYESWAETLHRTFGSGWHAYFAAKQHAEYAVINAKRLANGKKPKKPRLWFSASSPRDVAKSLFYTVIFGMQKDGCEEGECFRARFPDVYESFRTIKSRYCAYNPSKKNNKVGKGSYTNLMWMMQRLESTVVIDTCVANLLDMGITQIVPRHDSILAPTPLLEVVEQEMRKSFSQWQLPVPNIK